MILTGFILVASAMMTFGTSHQVHDADSLLPAVMSIKKLTWYYWSQNRFGNLLPFLASPVRGIKANFYLQVYLRHVCGFLSVSMVLALAGDRARHYEQFFVAVLTMLFAADRFTGAFFNPAVSQPVSCAVFVLGLWLAERSGGNAIARLGVWAAVTAVFWVAFFVNLSLVALVLPLGFGCWLLGLPSPLGNRASCAAMVLAFALAWLHARRFVPVTPTGLSPHWDALNVAAGAVASEIDLTALAMVLVGAGIIAAILRRCGPATEMGRQGDVAIPVQQLALSAAVVFTAVVYADTDWVQLNLNGSRYFNVIQLFAVVLPACWSWNMLCSAARLGPSLFGTVRPATVRAWMPGWRFALPAAALVAVALDAGPPGKLTFVTEARPDPLAVNADVSAILSHVPPGLPMIAVGKYWTAVPLVFARLARKGGSASYAAVIHWEPMRPDISGLLQSGRPFTLVCLSPNAPDCLPRALAWSGTLPGPRTTLIHGPAPLGDGGVYTIFSAGNGQPAAGYVPLSR